MLVKTSLFTSGFPDTLIRLSSCCWYFRCSFHDVLLPFCKLTTPSTFNSQHKSFISFSCNFLRSPDLLLTNSPTHFPQNPVLKRRWSYHIFLIQDFMFKSTNNYSYCLSRGCTKHNCCLFLSTSHCRAHTVLEGFVFDYSLRPASKGSNGVVVLWCCVVVLWCQEQWVCGCSCVV